MGSVRCSGKKEGGASNHVVRSVSHIGLEELDGLQPQLMYGAVLAYFRALVRSSLYISPALISLQTVAAIVALITVGTTLHLVLPRNVMLSADVLLVVTAFGAEVGFFFWMRRVRQRLHMVRPLAQRLFAPEGPAVLWRRTLECVEMVSQWEAEGRTPREWLEGWFLQSPIAEIRKGNVVDFLAWAACTKLPAELLPEEQSLVLQMYDEITSRFDLQFAEGRNLNVCSIRINFDPLKPWRHPLCYYLGVRTLVAATNQTMRFLGFTRYEPAGGVRFWRYPSRQPHGLLIVNGEPQAPRKLAPLVFIHGLGVGLAAYVRFIRRLTTGRECFVVELPEIEQVGCDTVLPPKALADAMGMMLKSFGHTSACFVAHSYGTFVLSWIIRERPDLVLKAVFIDPVCFLLCQPDVAFNFLYRKPKNWFQHTTANFVRRELYSANVLMRHFYWHHNVLWSNEIPPNSTVALCSKDDISPAHAVRRYLEERQRQGDLVGQTLKVLWFENFFHGEILLSRSAQVQVTELL